MPTIQNCILTLVSLTNKQASLAWISLIAYRFSLIASSLIHLLSDDLPII